MGALFLLVTLFSHYLLPTPSLQACVEVKLDFQESLSQTSPVLNPANQRLVGEFM